MPDYTKLNALPQMWAIAADSFGNTLALYDPHSKPEVRLTYVELQQQIQHFAAALQAKGISPGTKISLFADNSPRWLIADQGIMSAGAINIVRSSQADRQELLYILENSDSRALVVENRKTFERLAIADFPLDLVIFLSDEDPPAEKGINFSQMMEIGAQHSLQPVSMSLHDPATLLYTSGTSGRPKGVVLTHNNLLHQVRALPEVIQPRPGSRVLSILPSWHAYERSCEYFLFSRGCTQIYTNIRYFKKDLQQHKPQFMIGVPRLWESIYETIQKQLQDQPSPTRQRLVNTLVGASERYIKAKRLYQGMDINHLHPNAAERLKARLQATALAPMHAIAERLVYRKVRQAIGGNIEALISGGGSLAFHIDTFYETIDIPVLVGYGLTETAPVTNARRVYRNLRGSAGLPLPETEVRIIDLETRQPLPPEQKGIVQVRGSQVMQGYYKNPEATAAAIDDQGWFNTGDLGWVTPAGDLVLTGRAKDTIVLSNGENIEPQPIEDACVRSPYIDQIVVVGQDQRSLGALIVPNLEALQSWAQQQNLELPETLEAVQDNAQLREQLENNSTLQELYRKELTREVQNRPGYRADDRINVFRLMWEPFSQENGLMTQTMKIRRAIVQDRYSDIIAELYAK